MDELPEYKEISDKYREEENKLHEYAQKLQCEKTLRTYLEVLI